MKEIHLQAQNKIKAYKKIKIIISSGKIRQTAKLKKGEDLNEFALITNLYRLKTNKEGKYESLTQNFLANPFFLKLIYRSLKQQQYNYKASKSQYMYKSILSDILFKDIATKIKRNNFKFKRSQKKKIPKYGNLFKNAKAIHLSIQNELVEKILFLLLHQIFIAKEKIFYASAHGFIFNRSIHTTMWQLKQSWNGINWFFTVELKAMDQKKKLLFIQKTLQKKIKDRRFLDIIKNCIQVTQQNSSFTQNVSLPSKVINQNLFSLLSHLYLQEVDVYVETYVLPKYNKLKNLMSYDFYVKKENKITLKLYRRDLSFSKHRIRSSKVEKKIKVKYIRHVNLIIMGSYSNKVLIQLLKENLLFFLKSNLHVNLINKQAKCINAYSSRIKLLGFWFLTSLTGGVKEKKQTLQPNRKVRLQKIFFLKKKVEKQYRYFLIKKFKKLHFIKSSAFYTKNLKAILQNIFMDENTRFAPQMVSHRFLQSLLWHVTAKENAVLSELHLYTATKTIAKKTERGLNFDIKNKAFFFFFKKILHKKKVSYSRILYTTYKLLKQNKKNQIYNIFKNGFILQKFIKNLKKSKIKSKIIRAYIKKIYILCIKKNLKKRKEISMQHYPLIFADIKTIKLLLVQEKFITEHQTPQKQKYLTQQKDAYIIWVLNQKIINILFFYRQVENFSELKTIISYFGKASLLKTLAYKHKINSMRAVYCAYKFFIQKIQKFTLKITRKK